MSKYIIDTDQFEKLFETKAVAVLGIGDNLAVPEEGEKTVWTRMLNVADLEELNSDYINEYFGDLQDTAYQRGFEDGKKEAESSDFIEQAKADAFNKGMLFKEEKVHDAFLRGVEKGKAVHEKGCDGCEYAEMGSDTTICAECCNAYHNQWTAKDDEIEVGDEVKWNDDLVVITRFCDDPQWLDGIDKDGTAYHIFESNARKTGRHFDIASILEDMKRD